MWALLIKFWYGVVCKKCVWKEKCRILLNTSFFLLSPTKTNFKVFYLRFWILLSVITLLFLYNQSWYFISVIFLTHESQKRRWHFFVLIHLQTTAGLDRENKPCTHNHAITEIRCFILKWKILPKSLFSMRSIHGNIHIFPIKNLMSKIIEELYRYKDNFIFLTIIDIIFLP